MFYWIALVIGVLLLLGVFSRNKPGEKSFSLKERIGFGIFALVLVLVGFNGVRPKPPAPVAPATTPALTRQPVQTAPEPATTTQDEAGLPSAPTLPDLAWVDITLNLEKWPYGFKFNLDRIREKRGCGGAIIPRFSNRGYMDSPTRSEGAHSIVGGGCAIICTCLKNAPRAIRITI
jgi:hypothetical protein